MANRTEQEDLEKRVKLSDAIRQAEIKGGSVTETKVGPWDYVKYYYKKTPKIIKYGIAGGLIAIPVPIIGPVIGGLVAMGGYAFLKYGVGNAVYKDKKEKEKDPTADILKKMR